MTPDELAAQAIQIGDAVAAHLHARFGGRVRLDDLQSLARAAALHALEHWDGRGSMSRFAIQRARWRVIDALRPRRSKGPRPEADALRWTARVVGERVADVTALEEEESDLGAEQDSVAGLRSFFGRAAASYSVELDAGSNLDVEDPNANVEADVDRLKVRRAVAALPEEQRDVIEQHSYLGCTFDEIARARGTSERVLLTRFGRALESLRRMFTG